MSRRTRLSCSLAAACSTAALLFTSPCALSQSGLPYTIEPPEGSVEFGRSVASGGDVDGDGLPDIFVADPAFRVGNDIVGRWFIFSGSDGSLIFSETGERSLEGLGVPWIVGDFVGDLDGDGRDEFIVGLPAAERLRGVVLVYSITRREPLFTFIGEAERDLLGIEVRGVGDVTGDGVPDFAFVAQDIPAGFVSVRSGATGEEVYRVAAGGQRRPRRIRAAGDLDGDRVPDLIIGSFLSGQGQGAREGEVRAVSGTSGETLWFVQHTSTVGWALAAGADLTGDEVPDVVTMRYSPQHVLLISGSTGSVVAVLDAPDVGENWGGSLALANANADGPADLIVLRVTPARAGLDVLAASSGRIIHWVQGDAGAFPLYQFTGNEVAVADVNGDGSDDFIIGSVGSGVVVHGGSPLLLHFSERRSDYNITPGQAYAFTVVGARPGRTIHLLASIAGNGCTFIPRLGICIDLDQRIHRLGSAVAEPDRTARFTLEASPNLPRGPLWLQAIDPSDPNRGPITSNVMRLEVVD
ncbi:MAG: integrin alpha [Phycisphaerales bacterium]|nr:integrin alpha [Phycisphaerales bacterium]